MLVSSPSRWGINLIIPDYRLMIGLWALSVVWTVCALIVAYGPRGWRAKWWWASVPYTFLSAFTILISDSSYYFAHVLPFLWLLSWLTAISSAAWVVVSGIEIGITHTVPRTRRTLLMLILSTVVSLWMIPALRR